jgi:hypothetical protein
LGCIWLAVSQDQGLSEQLFQYASGLPLKINVMVNDLKNGRDRLLIRKISFFG